MLELNIYVKMVLYITSSWKERKYIISTRPNFLRHQMFHKEELRQYICWNIDDGDNHFDWWKTTKTSFVIILIIIFPKNFSFVNVLLPLIFLLPHRRDSNCFCGNIICILFQLFKLFQIRVTISFHKELIKVVENVKICSNL